MWGREFAALGSDRTVTRYDRRGLGRSPPATAAYSEMDDLRAVLGQGSGEPALIVGCSNGGRIAIDFALENPTAVRALLLVAPGLSGFTAELAPEGKPDYDRDNARSSAIFGAWSAGRREEALEGLRNYWCSATTGANRELVERMMRENAGEIFTDASARYETAVDPPAALRLRSLRVPTVVMYGDHDEPTMGHIVGRIVREIPGARFVPVPGGDHLVNLSRPEAFDAALGSLVD